MTQSPLASVWIYTDTRKVVGDADHLKVFADEDAANVWFRTHDPEGVAFEYQVQTMHATAAQFHKPCT